MRQGPIAGAALSRLAGCPLPAAASALTELPLLTRFKLRHKLAAFGVVGVALCLLPLWQLWNWHGLELQLAAQDAKAAEPGLLVVQTQRALLQHQLASARVLQRDERAEPLRREQQALVDARLLQLEQALAPGGMLPATIEVQAMRRDWPPLVQRIVQARCSVQESDHGHRLLQEQALQIIDIVSAALPAPRDPVLAQAQQSLFQSLPRELTSSLQAQSTQAWLDKTAQAEQAWHLASSSRQARHDAQRLLAAAGMLLAASLALAMLAWLARSLRMQPPPAGPGTTPLRAQAWQAPEPDGQQAQRLEGQRLMQRLRGPNARPLRYPPLDAPTQPHTEP